MALGTLQGTSNSSAMNYIAKPGCQTHCGNITVPYPFGIGKDTGCSLDDSFYMNCNTSFDPPKLYFASSSLESSTINEVFNISDSELRTFTRVGSRCYNKDGNVTNDFDSYRDIDECKDPEKYPCHGSCYNTQGNYICKCKKGYSGDPMIQGCFQRKPFQALFFSLDINECDRKEDFPCNGTCINTPGNYTCKCKDGYSGDGKIPNGCRRPVAGNSKFMKIIFISVLATLMNVGQLDEPRKVFGKMGMTDQCSWDSMYGSVLKSCSGLRDVRIGVQVHGSVVKSPYEGDVYVGSALTDMYTKCGNVRCAQKVLDGMRCRNVVTWNSLITCYEQNGPPSEALFGYVPNARDLEASEEENSDLNTLEPKELENQ
ncbi:pentatricopeptide repeat (PPR) superfamily protein [Artemisia annua]|uniref:Pentatricopeptide repeat (PPR) superfamily protein n=1 Tax=Artemisia annua TaxID=35608 RepID=A0A2U1NHV3_ARTAN|nr:pentatricopeptide repeat (PPR) superfamily protein [Artemisia annua]